MEKLFFVLTVIAVVENGLATRKVLIVGGGPVGLFAALKLHEVDPNIEIDLYEKRGAYARPQVVQLPFSASSTLPDDIKNELWSSSADNGKFLKALFHETQSTENYWFWPQPDEKYIPKVCICEFETQLKKHLERNKNFHFKNENYTMAHFKKITSEYNMILVATGDRDFATELRGYLKLTIPKQVISDGSYGSMSITLQANSKELYQAKNNVSNNVQPVQYYAANDSQNHVQMRFHKIRYSDITEDVKLLAEFKSDGKYLTLDGKKGGTDAKFDNNGVWFQEFQSIVQDTLKAYAVEPAKNTNVNVFYTKRLSYFYYEVAIFDYNLEAPILFLGESAGVSDYTVGYGLCRGLDAVAELINKRITLDFDTIATDYSIYWSELIRSKEYNFQKGMDRNPEALYKYEYAGRTIVDKAGDKIRDIRKHLYLDKRINIYHQDALVTTILNNYY